jgi:hypothetical protein
MRLLEAKTQPDFVEDWRIFNCYEYSTANQIAIVQTNSNESNPSIPLHAWWSGLMFWPAPFIHFASRLGGQAIAVVAWFAAHQG